MVPLTLIERLRALFQNGDMNSIQSKKDTTKEEDNSTNLPEEVTPPVMLNTLALSSDQETLYLIDNGRAIDFPLNNKNGVIIGTLKGQITVASAKESPATDPDGELPQVIRVTTKDSQWAGFYNEDNEIFGLIGAADLDISIAEPKTQVYFIDLKEKVINIKRKGILIEMTIFPKEARKGDSGGES